MVLANGGIGMRGSDACEWVPLSTRPPEYPCECPCEYPDEQPKSIHASTLRVPCEYPLGTLRVPCEYRHEDPSNRHAPLRLN